MNVLFATKTWEGDYHKFLSGAFERKWQSCNYPFGEKWLMLNNEVPKEANFSADRVINVGQITKETLKFFNLTKKELGRGYIYSIAELVCLFMAKDFDYLCWVQGDVIMSQNKDWVSPAIEILERDEDISVVSPFSEVNTWHNKEGLDQMFSDQAFIVRVNEFRRPIYSYNYPVLEQFPSHGGNSFERLCARYLHINNRYRKILTEFYAHHPCY